MRYVMVLCLLACVGCGPFREFGRGFQDKGMEMAGEITADALAEVVAGKLGDDFREVKDAAEAIRTGIPKQDSPEEKTLWYGLGGLLAYVVGSFGKGAVRKYAKKAA